MTSPTPPPPPSVAAAFDAWHTARHTAPVIARLYAEAMGERYPHEVAAHSSCDWPLLGLLVTRLRMPPGRHLLDAGCGTGGIGLWLARALAARLTGIDISAAAIAHATARAPDFLPADRAEFRIADLQDTRLPEGCAQAIVCVDALTFAADQTAALRELARVLAPGGRLALTRAVRSDTDPAFAQLAQAAGLLLEHVDERPDEPATWEAVLRARIRHADTLRNELGDNQAKTMLASAQRMRPSMEGRRAVLLTLRRPVTEEATVATDTMTGPDQTEGPRAPSERTPQ